MALLREASGLVRNMPALVARRAGRTVAESHRMVDVGERRAPEPWCVRCDVAWPCDEFVLVSDRLVKTQGSK